MRKQIDSNDFGSVPIDAGERTENRKQTDSNDFGRTQSTQPKGEKTDGCPRTLNRQPARQFKNVKWNLSNQSNPVKLSGLELRDSALAGHLILESRDIQRSATDTEERSQCAHSVHCHQEIQGLCAQGSDVRDPDEWDHGE